MSGRKQIAKSFVAKKYEDIDSLFDGYQLLKPLDSSIEPSVLTEDILK